MSSRPPLSPAQDAVVEARGVTKAFGPRVAVDGLDLTIPAGVCFGLLGPNGAGKTTTLRMLYGVTRPSSGSIRVFGMDVAAHGRAVRARLGVTLQENALIEALTPIENLRVFCRYHLLDAAAAERRSNELMEFLELESHRDVPVRQLSGGFQRRLAIALSLVSDPELLVLDEPTTGLDPAVRLALWSRVRALRERGKTVLLTTHYMDEAERLCDRVAVMAHGRVIAEGAPRVLIEETLARETVEIDCTPAEEAMVLAGLAPAPRRLRAGGRVILYTDDAAALVEHIRARDPREHRPLVLRPTNLEDVFLALTGTSMESAA